MGLYERIKILSYVKMSYGHGNIFVGGKIWIMKLLK